VGIWIAAIVATSLAAWIGRALLRAWIGHDRLYYRVLAITLLFSPIVNLCAKKPILGYMLHRFHLSPKTPDWPWWFVVLVLLLIGVSEEGIKLTPVSFPSVRKAIRLRGSAVPMAFTIGLGFAIGEIWYLAFRIHFSDPASASLPFYMLGGFITERVGTVIVHAWLSLLALSGLRSGSSQFLLGAGGAMLAHALMDSTAMLFQMKLVSVETAILVFIPLTFLCTIPFYRFRGNLALTNRIGRTGGVRHGFVCLRLRGALIGG
jgi:uncharacterized membrane protein YhfC